MEISNPLEASVMETLYHPICLSYMQKGFTIYYKSLSLRDQSMVYLYVEVAQSLPIYFLLMIVSYFVGQK